MSEPDGAMGFAGLTLHDDDDNDLRAALKQALAQKTSISGMELIPTDAAMKVAVEVARQACNAAIGFVGNRGTCILLGGAKGTGKTSLLRALACGALQQALQGKVKIRALYLDLSVAGDDDHAATVFQLAAGLTPDLVSVERAILLANERLGTKHTCLVVFLDEFQAIYTGMGDPDLLKSWHLAAYSIPNISYPQHQRRRIFVVASGSSPWLRGLAFGHFDGRVRDKFPAYTLSRMNLNSQRYTYSALGTVSEAELGVHLESCAKASGRPLTYYEADVKYIYFMTGGNIGATEDILSRKAALAYHLIKHRQQPISMAMAGALERSMQEKSVRDPTSEVLMDWLPVADLGDLGKDLKGLYQAADSGTLIYDDVRARVRFPSPVLAAVALSWVLSIQVNSWLTPYLRLCLAHPFSSLGDDAEEAVRQCLAVKLKLKSLPGKDAKFDVEVGSVVAVKGGEMKVHNA